MQTTILDHETDNRRVLMHLLLLCKKNNNATMAETARACRMPINVITWRFKDLREQGIIAQDERRQCLVKGTLANAWKVL